MTTSFIARLIPLSHFEGVVTLKNDARDARLARRTLPICTGKCSTTVERKVNFRATLFQTTQLTPIEDEDQRRNSSSFDNFVLSRLENFAFEREKETNEDEEMKNRAPIFRRHLSVIASNGSNVIVIC